MAYSDKQSVGFSAEQTARRFLESNGLNLIAQNYRCKLGEIDLIMQHDKQLVFVEVRFRARNNYASAALTVGHIKRARIVRTACLFLKTRRDLSDSVMRFDVVAIDEDRDGEQHITWLTDAFRP